MRRLAAALVLLLGACSDAGDDAHVLPLDAGEWYCDGGLGLRCSPVPACNPVENTGCASDYADKCSWVWIDTDNDLGTVGCVPDGTVELGDACYWGPDGEATGYDNCVAGGVCIDGICESICTVSPDSCDVGYACARAGALFVGLTPALGSCGALCDPVVQDCATGACYGAPDGPFLCEVVPDVVLADPDSYSQEDPALTFADGVARPNGCAPGFAPLLAPTDVALPPTLCIAYCSPVPTSAESPAGAGGGNAHTCTDRGAPTQECRYFWYLEDGKRHPDAVGFCWTPETYSQARCTSISETDPAYATSGCAPFTP